MKLLFSNKVLKVFCFMLTLSFILISCNDINKPEDVLKQKTDVSEDINAGTNTTAPTTPEKTPTTETDPEGKLEIETEKNDVTNKEEAEENSDTSSDVPSIVVSEEVRSTYGHLGLNDLELSLVDQTLQEALDNSKVFVLEKNPENWFYYNQLKKDTKNPHRKDMYEMLIKMVCGGAFVKGEAYPHQYPLKFYSQVFDDVAIAWRAVKYDHPEFFYVGLVTQGFEGIGDFQLVTINGIYDTIDELQMEEQLAYAGAEKMLEGFDENASLTEQVKFIYEKVSQKYYLHGITDHKYGHSAYGILTNGQGVCEGYSLAVVYLALLAKVKTPVILVVGDAWNAGNHAWNAYKTENNVFFEFDATWNKWQTPTNISYGNVSKRYFPNSPDKYPGM